MEALKEIQGWTDDEGKGEPCRRGFGLGLISAPSTVHEPVKFNQVAMKYSEDAAKDGGNLGWRTRQQARIASAGGVSFKRRPFGGDHAPPSEPAYSLDGR
jgi:hypothetical protein